MPGILYVVATPIGNLEDVTFRALRVLREVALIAAEDTRRTARLLQHYSISTPTTSLHEHNERAKTPALLERLQSGQSVALVSDAGTPVLSDPGTLLVDAAHKAGIRVEPVPGPSAALAALSASGMPAEQVVFAGFPPSRSNDRIRWLTAIQKEPRTVILYEAPHRIRQTLTALLDVAGDRTIVLGRELTKKHEELVRCPISAALDRLGEPRGEYTIVLSPPDRAPAETPRVPAGEQLASEFGQIAETSGRSRRAAVRALAEKYGVPAREMYDRLERAKISVE